MSTAARPASSGSRLNCGKRKLPGRLRTSQSVLTLFLSRTARKSASSRLGWPTGKKEAVGGGKGVVMGVLALLFFSVLDDRAQRVKGELRIEVHDPQGAVVAPACELVSEANQFRKQFVTGPDGRYVVQDLPFGVYRLSLHADGFAPWS